MQRSQNILRRTALSAAAAIVFGVALGAAGSALAAAPSASMAVTATHATTLRNGDVIDGMVPFTQPIHVEVSLRLRNAAALASFIENASRPESTQRTMAPADFIAQHAPTADQAQAVVDFLNQAGFRNVTVAPNRLLVSADG